MAETRSLVVTQILITSLSVHELFIAIQPDHKSRLEAARFMNNQNADEIAERIANGIHNLHDMPGWSFLVQQQVKQIIARELAPLLAEIESLKRGTLFDDAAAKVYSEIDDERKALIADRQRLDWLAKNRKPLHFYRINSDPSWYVDGDNTQTRHIEPRQAIDAAMKK